MIQGYYFAKPMPQAEYENTVIPVPGQQVQAPVEAHAAPAEAPVAQAVPVPSVEPAPVVEQTQAVEPAPAAEPAPAEPEE